MVKKTTNKNTQGNKKKQGVAFVAEYLKDISFESPNSPDVFSREGKPSIDVTVDVGVNSLAQEDAYEVVLTVSVSGKYKKYTYLITEVKYAGIFHVVFEKEEDVKKALLVDSATLLFPFVRQIIANLTREGGFPPVVLSPINFLELYEENNSKKG